jgi:hypothetical protein
MKILLRVLAVIFIGFVSAVIGLIVGAYEGTGQIGLILGALTGFIASGIGLFKKRTRI